MWGQTLHTLFCMGTKSEFVTGLHTMFTYYYPTADDAERATKVILPIASPALGHIDITTKAESPTNCRLRLAARTADPYQFFLAMQELRAAEYPPTIAEFPCPPPKRQVGN